MNYDVFRLGVSPKGRSIVQVDYQQHFVNHLQKYAYPSHEY